MSNHGATPGGADSDTSGGARKPRPAPLLKSANTPPLAQGNGGSAVVEVEAPQATGEVTGIDAVMQAVVVGVECDQAAGEDGRHRGEPLRGRCGGTGGPQQRAGCHIEQLQSGCIATNQQCALRERRADAHIDQYGRLRQAIDRFGCDGTSGVKQQQQGVPSRLHGATGAVNGMMRTTPCTCTDCVPRAA